MGVAALPVGINERPGSIHSLGRNNRPKGGARFEREVVHWYEDARKPDISFIDRNKSRDAILNEIRHALPNDTAPKLMPFLVPVQLVGFRDTVDLVCSDIVEMMKSMLTNENLMQNECLHINEANPFDNYRCGLDSGEPISEPQLGSVYQTYLRNRPNNPNEFVFGLIIYTDRTHIDLNSELVDNPIKLIDAIKVLIHDTLRAQYPIASIVSQLSKWINIKQHEDENLTEYVKRD